MHGLALLKVQVMPTWTPKVRRIMASMAAIMGFGLLFHILLGLRYHTSSSFFLYMQPVATGMGYEPLHRDR